VGGTHWGLMAIGRQLAIIKKHTYTQIKKKKGTLKHYTLFLMSCPSLATTMGSANFLLSSYFIQKYISSVS